MAKADESKSKSAEGAPQQYNPHTAQWEPVEDEARIAEHEAQREGKPAPGDRTEEELKGGLARVFGGAFALRFRSGAWRRACPRAARAGRRRAAAAARLRRGRRGRHTQRSHARCCDRDPRDTRRPGKQG